MLVIRYADEKKKNFWNIINFLEDKIPRTRKNSLFVCFVLICSYIIYFKWRVTSLE